MALSELAALEAAYQILQPLDPAGRRRALQWLSDALGTQQPLAAAGDTAPADDTATGSRSTTRRSRAKSAPAAATERPARRRAKSAAVAAVPASRSRRSRSARQAESAPGEGQGRAYRRMPPADEVMAAYEQIGSVSGLADHFDVPRHTVQGWARQLRRQGHAIGRTRE